MGVPESWATIQSSWGAKAPELFVALVVHYFRYGLHYCLTKRMLK